MGYPISVSFFELFQVFTLKYFLCPRTNSFRWYLDAGQWAATLQKTAESVKMIVFDFNFCADVWETLPTGSSNTKLGKDYIVYLNF